MVTMWPKYTCECVIGGWKHSSNDDGVWLSIPTVWGFSRRLCCIIVIFAKKNCSAYIIVSEYWNDFFNWGINTFSPSLIITWMNTRVMAMKKSCVHNQRQGSTYSLLVEYVAKKTIARKVITIDSLRHHTYIVIVFENRVLITEAYFNTLCSRQNGRNLADDILNVFSWTKACVFIQLSLKVARDDQLTTSQHKQVISHHLN